MPGNGWKYGRIVLGALLCVVMPGLSFPGAAPLQIKNGVRIIDHNGRSIRMTQPFERVISLYGAHTENLFALGLDTQIVGVERNAAYPPQAGQKPVFSYHDDPEKFLAARPDLVLIRPMIERGYARLVARLERHGITVVSLQPGSVAQMYVYWEVLGLLTGRREAAATMIASFKEAVDGYRQRVSTIRPKKRVYFEAVHDKMKTFTPDAMAIFALETAGGINVAADATAVRGTNIAFYGKERLLAQGARIDVYLAQFGAMNRPTPAVIKNEPGFELIKAVRQNNIGIIDEQIVSRPTLRLLAGIQVIGEILYPAVFRGARQP